MPVRCRLQNRLTTQPPTTRYTWLYTQVSPCHTNAANRVNASMSAPKQHASTVIAWTKQVISTPIRSNRAMKVNSTFAVKAVTLYTGSNATLEANNTLDKPKENYSNDFGNILTISEKNTKTTPLAVISTPLDTPVISNK